MKKIIFLIAMLMICASSYAQVYKLKTTSLATRVKNSYGWPSWGAFQSTSVLITIDVDHERIKIFSATTQVYDITYAYDKYIDADGDSNYEFDCVDSDGLRCTVQMIMGTNRSQMYIKYSDMQWVYNVYKI